MIRKQEVALEKYDEYVLMSGAAQHIHSALIKYHDAFDRNVTEYKDYIEIGGCETPIFMYLGPTKITFMCRSKVLRSYLFCMILNYVDDPNYNFNDVVKKYSLNITLTETRIEALRNAMDLVVKLDKDTFLSCFSMHKYIFQKQLKYLDSASSNVLED